MDFDRMFDRRKISAARFIDGGAPRFIHERMNNQREILGPIDKIPTVKDNLRVFVISYIELAILNNAEEASPWANIISKVPVILHLENKVRLASNKPIWLTEA